VEVRLWHEFVRDVSLIAAKTTEGRSLFAPAFLWEHSRNECPDLQVYNDGVEVARILLRGPRQVRSTLRRLALLADRAACFEFLDLIGRERNLARPDQVDGDLADAVGRIDRELVERLT
jgi:hypothetical protein